MMKCTNCGNEIKEGAKFCTKCGTRILEQQENTVNVTVNEENTNVEQERKVFNFEKVKMIGRMIYKKIYTEVISNDDNLSISQHIHRFLLKDQNKNVEIKLSEISSVEVKTKMDFWDTFYAALIGVLFLLDTSNVALLILIVLFLYTGYGKSIDLKMKNGAAFSIPVNGMTEDVQQFQRLNETIR